MTKIKTSVFLALLMLMVAVCGCTKNEQPPAAEPVQRDYYACSYPIFAMAEGLLKGVDDVQLHCLIQPQDGCLRDYAISDWDLALLSSADAVFAGGRGLESFESMLYTLGEKGPVVTAVLYDMELSSQKAINSSREEDSHWTGDNPHIYLSIDAAAEIAERIAAALTVLDPDNQEIYKTNLQTTTNRLKSLQGELQQLLNTVQKEPVIIMNEALVYAAGEYGLTIECCYVRESGEKLEDYDFESCLQMLSAYQSRVILIEKQAPFSLIQALQDAGYKVIPMDTLSTRRADEGFDGYIDAHRENVQAIVETFKAQENAANN